jgi:hypothetical protein
VPPALAGQGGIGATPERVIVRRLDPCEGEGPDDSLAVMEVDPRGPMVVPPRYEVLRRLDPWEEMAELPILEQPTRARALRADRDRRLWEVNGRPLRSTPVRTLAEELDSVPADPQGWLRLPFGPTQAPASVQCRIERGLYKGPVDLYRAEALCTFAYTQVAVRAGETPVAPAGYFILPGSPQRVTDGGGSRAGRRGAWADSSPTGGARCTLGGVALGVYGNGGDRRRGARRAP